MSAQSLLSRLFLLVALCFAFAGILSAQQTAVIRVTQAVDNSVRVPLPGNTHPLARAEFDQGAAPPDLPMKRMLLVLKRSAEQESALRQMLDSQQDKNSSSYHRWLTPQEFGTRFGPADSDVAAVSNWLKSSGFQVAPVSKGRTVIEFSGTAAQVQAAFQTSIHKYSVNGKQHWANAGDPQIPAALQPVVAGVSTLHNFFKQPQIAKNERAAAIFNKSPVPYVTFSDGKHALGPSDYAKIYNFGSTFPATINGTGVTIAVVARSEYDPGDIFDFYGALGLTRNFPQVILNGDSPGDLGGGEEGEAILDATWSGILAPGATVDFVVSASTNTSDGVDLSELYIVDNNLAEIMTESFGSCEFFASSAHVAFASGVAEQAAAEGITYTVSTGDSGAEGCDRPSQPTAAGPVSPSLVSGTPFNVAVGGTMFNEGTQVSKYWGSSAPLAETALSYIPENVWNESCTTATCGASAALWAGGGGVSSIFPKPSWQSGVTGIPNDGFRDQPDVSLTAAGHDPYLVCFQRGCANGFINFVSGTSAAAPSFAAIMALIDQKTGSRQGQANYVLYRLAAADIAGGRKCNGSGTTLPGNTCNFNDVTVGNNAVPGETGFGTSGGKYQSTVGYDLATGLGSVNVANLLTNWASVSFSPTTTTLTLNPTTITHGAAVTVGITVAPVTGTAVPTGDVSLRNADTGQVNGSGFIDRFTLSNGAVTGQTTKFLPGGTYHIIAHYAGDKTFAPSDSAASATVTVSPEGTTTALQVKTIDASNTIIDYGTQTYGSIGFFRVDVTANSWNGVPSGTINYGAPSGTINYFDNGGFLGISSTLNSEGTGTTPFGLYATQVGTHSIAAHYVGPDPSFTGSNSAPVIMTVTKGPVTTTLTSSKSAVAEGATVTLTATLATTSYSQAPTGTVTFYSGGVQIVNNGNPMGVFGTNGTGNLQNGNFATATATIALATTLPVGQDSITAQYSGDANYLTSTSSPVTVSAVADFDLAVDSTLSVNRGVPGTVMVTVTGHPGYAGTINFTGNSCTALPAETTCSFNPPSLTGSGTSVLTIKTTAPAVASANPAPWWATGFGGVVAGFFLLGTGRKRRWSGALAVLVFASLTTIVSCGGGGSSGPPPDKGTPVGTYTVQVHVADSTGVDSHIAAVSLKVN